LNIATSGFISAFPASYFTAPLNPCICRNVGRLIGYLPDVGEPVVDGFRLTKDNGTAHDVCRVAGRLECTCGDWNLAPRRSDRSAACGLQALPGRPKALRAACGPETGAGPLGQRLRRLRRSLIAMQRASPRSDPMGPLAEDRGAGLILRAKYL
jgi:hypothetical protein